MLLRPKVTRKIQKQIHVSYIPHNTGLSELAYLPAKLKLSVGPRIILTDNISVSDRLINGSIGTVKHINRRSKPLCSTIYVKSDDLKLAIP